MRVFSPSQITSFTRCARQWHYSKIDPIRDEEGPEPEHFVEGRVFHEVLEDYFLQRPQRAPRSDQHLAMLAGAAADQRVPRPGTPGLKVEVTLARSIMTPAGPCLLQARADLVLVTPGRVVVYDHKTHSGRKLGALAKDTQAIINAWLWGGRHPDVEAIEACWLYHDKRQPGLVDLHKAARATGTEALPRPLVDAYMAEVVVPTLAAMIQAHEAAGPLGRRHLALVPKATPWTGCFNRKAMCSHWDRCQAQDRVPGMDWVSDL